MADAAIKTVLCALLEKGRTLRRSLERFPCLGCQLFSTIRETTTLWPSHSSCKTFLSGAVLFKVWAFGVGLHAAAGHDISDLKPFVSERAKKGMILLKVPFFADKKLFPSGHRKWKDQGERENEREATKNRKKFFFGQTWTPVPRSRSSKLDFPGRIPSPRMALDHVPVTSLHLSSPFLNSSSFRWPCPFPWPWREVSW